MASKILVNLDTSKELYGVFKCKQNDDLTLEANTYENGASKDLTNCSIVVQAKKADNTYIIQNTDITKDKNKFIANLVRDFTRVAGKTEIEVVLMESGKQNTTFSFCLEVVESVIKGAEESKDLITSLEVMQDAVVEMGKISEGTKELIKNSGAASKEEMNKVNASLAEKASTIGVSYADFGVKGDGVTNDYQAIYDAHVYANEHDCKIFGDGTKTYLIGDKGNLPKIPIKTGVDWCGATFIIDDRNITSFDDIFDIGVMEKTKVSATGTFVVGQTKTELKDGVYCFYNSRVKNFIRSGNNADNGVSQQETVVVKNNKILTTFGQEINYDSYEYKPINNKNIIIANAKFITKPSITDQGKVYRGIRVTASNVIIDNIEHEFEGEDKSDYVGFIILDMAYNTKIKNSNFPRHKKSKTYELNFSNSAKIELNNVKVDNINQVGEEWHIMITNHCKNMIINDSVIDCVDAHRGIVDLEIRNSVLGEIGVAVVGWGKLLIEYCDIYSQALVSLRGDYGSFWNGDIKLKNINHRPQSGVARTISYQNVGKHNYGYKTHCGYKWEIENIKLYDKDLTATYTYLIQNDVNMIGSGERSYPLIFPDEVSFKNMKSDSNKGYIVFYGSLENMIMPNNHKYTNLYNIRENMMITIEDINLRQFTSGGVNSDIIPSEFSIGMSIFGENKVCIPKIKFKNCKSLWCATKGYPMILEILNTELRNFNLYGSNTGIVAKGFVDKCIFNIRPFTVTQYVRGDYEFIYFNECKFNIDGNYSDIELKTIYTFLANLAPSTSDKKMVGYFSNCFMYEGFDFNLLGDYSIYGFDMNEEFKRWYTRTCKKIV